ncbi:MULTISPECIES: XrtA/PEP-CTERM system histidine kinase PrsK [unclassified Ectothiorhodospira]|uniref:XrtA/PEP-CTERM system histidine kinase PrsK n=1 Tax=unclassified Ectothiorhodospira TaxID=2684909 RepID=UPI001EE9A9BD|nr:MULTISPECIES: XrtA/PEP-CTERM system histidine kinase PrsK [unclassified Ectothiorhodospira]MCG5517339.1 PEP-CTERM system histidine kinase PrsK [Ectothiorhodospira sp. 9100]MCG5520233.1 PEP-CTERM system histidine kinase PrsK [Ectothiorhodospira sp. 9905]
MDFTFPLGLVSYSIAAAAFFILLAVLAIGWQRRLQGSLLIIAVALSILWGATLALNTTQGQIVGTQMVLLAELARDAGWIAFLWGLLWQARDLQLARPGEDLAKPIQTPRRAGPSTEPEHDTAHLPGSEAVSGGLGTPLVALGAGALTLVLSLSAYLGVQPLLPEAWVRSDIILGGKLLLVLIVLLLVEQIFRNTSTEGRWAIKYLCLGLGGVYGFDFYMYAEALLFRQVYAGLWEARGFVNALVVPLIAVSAARNPQWSLDVYVSRGMVFHTATLLGAGIYLLLMAAAGYYLRVFGGEWGTVFQSVFLFAALLGLAVFVISGRFRAQFRVFVSKHFFNYKYDYREEWLRFIRTLADSTREEGLPVRVVRALADIVDSPGGQLWMRNGGHQFSQTAQWSMADPPPTTEPWDGHLASYLLERGWVLDIMEARKHPDRYPGLTLPAWLAESERAWLLVPLKQDDELLGFVLLAPSRALRIINWEDRDLLKTAGLQAASHLAQMEALQALSEARQFEAFNRLSAYVVHDLKNIIAQLSLVVSNAQKHGDNPEFLKDAIGTVENAVARMNKLMLQLRSGDPGREATPVDLADLATQAVNDAQGRAPEAKLEHNGGECPVLADPERLRSVLNHLIQNAQEATPDNGRVNLSLWKDTRQAYLDVIDTGTGMTPEFIRERLFRPFDTTKGLTGMGIGAFESREFIRALGGDLEVWSEPGKGSRFRITIPLAQQQKAPLPLAGEGVG